MAALGFASGLPMLLTASTLVSRLSEQGVDIRTIGLLSLVGLPYALRFLWAPFLDLLAVPWLAERMGRRQAMILVVQVCLCISIVALGLAPSDRILAVSCAALVVSFLSATQDALIDAFRIESVPEEKQASALAAFTSAYRLAMAVSFAGCIVFVDAIRHYLPSQQAWFLAYASMSSLLLIGILAIVLSREGPASRAGTSAFSHRGSRGARDGDGLISPPYPASFFSHLCSAVMSSLRPLVRRSGALYILLFILTFKIGDIFAIHMLIPFLTSKGYAPRDYALLNSSVGLFCGFLGSFFVDFLIRKFGLRASILVAGLAQNLVNLVFVVIDFSACSLPLLNAAICLENFCYSLGSVAFVTWMSGLCRESSCTATEFSLLVALSAIGRTVFPACSGYLASHMGYSAFFAFTVVLGLPSLFFFMRIR